MTTKREWHENFFGGANDLYTNAYTAMGVFDKKDAEREVDGLLAILNPEPGSHILDWCGGWGRIAIPLAKRGFRVTLLDFCGAYLTKAMSEAVREGVASMINPVSVDFRQTPANIKADYAVNMFTAGLGYFGEKEDVMALKSLHTALKPGARIFIDVMSLFWIVRNFQARSWQESSDGKKWYLERRRMDFMTNTLHMDAIFCTKPKLRQIPARNDLIECGDQQLRLYSPADLARVLEEAGFIPSDISGDFDGSPFTFNSKRVIMTATRLS